MRFQTIQIGLPQTQKLPTHSETSPNQKFSMS